jgi:transposase
MGGNCFGPSECAWAGCWGRDHKGQGLAQSASIAVPPLAARAAELIKKTRRLFPFVKHIFADGGYSGDRLATDLAAQQVTLEIVKRADKEGGLKLIRRRWVIERTFSWIRRNRRLMAHYEAIASIAVGFARLAMTSVMLKRLTEPRPKTAT